MIYSKKIFIIAFLFLISIQTSFASYYEKWKDICNVFTGTACGNGINQVSIDVDSVNVHNDSVYYSIRYYGNHNGGVVAIIQSKNGKAGVAQTYKNSDYEDIMHNSIKNPHPAYVAKEAKELKELDKNSFMYSAYRIAMKIVELKKQGSYGTYDMTLHNGLYGM